jgi:hypothetical protein
MERSNGTGVDLHAGNLLSSSATGADPAHPVKSGLIERIHHTDYS